MSDILRMSTTTTTTRNFDFIDGIRCIAMMSIVMEHAVSLSIYKPKDDLSIFVLCSWTQFIKFGTINFFLLAGFLIGEKFVQYTPLQYMRRRIKSTIGPWIFWSILFVAILCLDDLVKAIKFNSSSFGVNYKAVFFEHLRAVYFYSNYWFIPNFLCCIGILLIFRKYLYSYLFGVVLALTTLIYTINIYFEWIEPRHSVALFGFIFFLWLGAQINKRLDQFEKFVNSLSYTSIIIAIVIFAIGGILEEMYLMKNNSVDPYNTLRISNILFSLACFLLFYKIKGITIINFLKPRETTYGIYLIHFILVASFLPLIFVSLKYNVASLTLPELILYQLSRFIIVYILTYLIVTGINKTRFKKLIGR